MYTNVTMQPVDKQQIGMSGDIVTSNQKRKFKG